MAPTSTKQEIKKMKLSPKAQRLVDSAEVIGTVEGVTYYEAPNGGDEVPLMIINAEGKARYSDHWELPQSSWKTEING